MSSSSARRTTSTISGCIGKPCPSGSPLTIEAVLDFAQLGFVFQQLGANTLDHFCRSLAQENLVPELPLRVGYVFDQLVALLFQTPPLRFKLAVRDVQNEIEIRRRPDRSSLRDLSHHQRNACQPLHG